ncbi:MAG: homoserine dehydrogenase [Syntrophomonadaceae bacterium]|nr:homoserine dehydrogenase [Syntrophomonadaceae bacterium]
MINIGLIGCGTVGSGVVKLLQKNSEVIAKRAGCRINIKKIAEIDAEKITNLALPEDIVTADINEILNAPDIDIVVELIGGLEPAYNYIMTAMHQGKHVVTANKDLIAVKSKEIFKLAADKNLDFCFEASVAGGIPVIYPLKHSLSANNINAVIGILNGTTNYILTKMTDQGQSLQEVLREAQALGYAEANPDADVAGLDAARKIAILSSIAFNSSVSLDDVYVEGILDVTPSDIEHARALGYVIKLLAIAEADERQQVQVRVHPAFIPKSHPIATVNDVYNAVFIHGDAVGDIMLYGRGAGQAPTASAVVGDIIEVARNTVQNVGRRVGCAFYGEKTVLNISELSTQYYIRMKVQDKPGVLASIAGVFGANRVSISTVLQPVSYGEWAELILITHKVKEQDLQESLLLLKDMSMVSAINSVIRVEGAEN